MIFALRGIFGPFYGNGDVYFVTVLILNDWRIVFVYLRETPLQEGEKLNPTKIGISPS